MRRAFLLGIASVTVLVMTAAAAQAQKTTPTVMSAETAECNECHANRLVIRSAPTVEIQANSHGTTASLRKVWLETCWAQPRGRR